MASCPSVLPCPLIENINLRYRECSSSLPHFPVNVTHRESPPVQQPDPAKSMCIFWSARQTRAALPSTLSMCRWRYQFSIQTHRVFSEVFCLECSNDRITSRDLMGAEHYWVNASSLFLWLPVCSLPSWNAMQSSKHFTWNLNIWMCAAFPRTDWATTSKLGTGTHLMAALSKKLSCGITRVSGDDKYRSNWTCWETGWG